MHQHWLHLHSIVPSSRSSCPSSNIARIDAPYTPYHKPNFKLLRLRHLLRKLECGSAPKNANRQASRLCCTPDARASSSSPSSFFTHGTLGSVGNSVCYIVLCFRHAPISLSCNASSLSCSLHSPCRFFRPCVLAGVSCWHVGGVAGKRPAALVTRLLRSDKNGTDRGHCE